MYPPLPAFDISELEEINPALRRFAVASNDDSIAQAHLTPFRELGTELDSSRYAVESAVQLTIRYGDLVVALIEPNDSAEKVSYDEENGVRTSYKWEVRMM